MTSLHEKYSFGSEANTVVGRGGSSSIAGTSGVVSSGRSAEQTSRAPEAWAVVGADPSVDVVVGSGRVVLASGAEVEEDMTLSFGESKTCGSPHALSASSMRQTLAVRAVLRIH